MGNYDLQLALGQKLFLEWNQEEMISRHHLQADDQYLYVNFLGMPHRIRRNFGEVEKIAAAEPADPLSSLSIFDYLCRDNLLPGMCGRRCSANSLSCAARSSPNTTSLHQPMAEYLQNHVPALRRALADSGYPSFPHGDAACIFPVFDCLDTVFQFWEGDEEFPPSIRFLWDENTPYYLRYETLYFIMGCFLDSLRDRIVLIEKNVK